MAESLPSIAEMDPSAPVGAPSAPGWHGLVVPFVGPAAAFRLLAWPRPSQLGEPMVVLRSGPGTVQLRHTGLAGSDDGGCAARQAWMLGMAARAGGSRVTLRHDKCLARGDTACDYTVSWTDEPRAAPAVVAGLIAAGMGGVAASFGMPDAAWALVPVPAAIAYALERRRVARANRVARADGRAAFRWLLERAHAARPAAIPETNDPTQVPSDGITAVVDTTGTGAHMPSLEQEGEFWRVSYEGTTISLRHSRGLLLLAHLVRYAGRDLHVRELDAMTPAGGSAVARQAPVATGHLAVAAGDDVQTLDARAQGEYRRRVSELRAELEQAEEWNDLGRGERLRTELAQLTEQLRAAATGGRRASDDGERLRVAITRRIRSAIVLVAKHHPALGAHFERHVTTGFSCSYRPDSTRGASPSGAKQARARLR